MFYNLLKKQSVCYQFRKKDCDEIVGKCAEQF